MIAATPPSTGKKQVVDSGAGVGLPTAATPPSTAKKQAVDRGAGVGMLLSPTASSSKKPRLSPLDHAPRAAMSPAPNTKRSLYAEMQSPGSAMPSPPAESPPPLCDIFD